MTSQKPLKQSLKDLKDEKTEKEPSKETDIDTFQTTTLKTLLKECSQEKDEVEKTPDSPEKHKSKETNIDDIMSVESLEIERSILPEKQKVIETNIDDIMSIESFSTLETETENAPPNKQNSKETNVDDISMISIESEYYSTDTKPETSKTPTTEIPKAQAEKIKPKEELPKVENEDKAKDQTRLLPTDQSKSELPKDQIKTDDLQFGNFTLPKAETKTELPKEQAEKDKPKDNSEPKLPTDQNKKHVKIITKEIIKYPESVLKEVTQDTQTKTNAKVETKVRIEPEKCDNKKEPEALSEIKIDQAKPSEVKIDIPEKPKVTSKQKVKPEMSLESWLASEFPDLEKLEPPKNPIDLKLDLVKNEEIKVRSEPSKKCESTKPESPEKKEPSKPEPPKKIDVKTKPLQITDVKLEFDVNTQKLESVKTKSKQEIIPTVKKKVTPTQDKSEVSKPNLEVKANIKVPGSTKSTEPPKSDKLPQPSTTTTNSSQATPKSGTKTVEVGSGVKNAKSCELNGNNALSVTDILDDNSTEADRIFAQYKNRSKRLFKSNLIIEGTCNYFFWIDKIALVSEFKTKLYY